MSESKENNTTTQNGTNADQSPPGGGARPTTEAPTPSTQAAAPAPAAPALDPTVAAIAKSLGMALDGAPPPDGKPVVLPEPIDRVGTVSDMVERRDHEERMRKEKEAAGQRTIPESGKTAAAAAVSSAANGAPAATDAAKNAPGQETQPTETPAAPKKVAGGKSVADRLREEAAAGRGDEGRGTSKSEGEGTPGQGTRATETPAAKQPPATDDPDKDLQEWQRDEIAFAKFAGEKDPKYKGRQAEMRSYYSKLDEFSKANPDASDDQLREFVERHEPKYEKGDRRRLERDMIRDEVAATAKADAAKETQRLREEVERTRRELTLAPKVAKSVEEFTERLGSNEIPLPEGVTERIDPAVIEVIRNEGYQAAVEKFPIDAPLVAQSVQAVEAFRKISLGLEAPDLDGNATHQWVANFIAQQGNIYAKHAPKEERVRDGREFLPRHEFMALLGSDPKKAQGHWTWTDDEVVELIGINAQIAKNTEVKRLEKAGFRRASATNGEMAGKNDGRGASKSEGEGVTPGGGTRPTEATQNPSAANPDPATEGSAKGGRSMSPGAASTGAAPNPNAEFFKSLGPGVAKMMGV